MRVLAYCTLRFYVPVLGTDGMHHCLASRDCDLLTIRYISQYEHPRSAKETVLHRLCHISITHTPAVICNLSFICQLIVQCALTTSVASIAAASLVREVQLLLLHPTAHLTRIVNHCHCQMVLRGLYRISVTHALTVIIIVHALIA